jgi:hypothetical protein
MIAGRGSVYALLLVAGLDLHYHVSQLIGCTAWEVAKMLRCPETAGELFFGRSEWKLDTDAILRFTHRSPNTFKDYSYSIEILRDPATLIGQFLLS